MPRRFRVVTDFDAKDNMTQPMNRMNRGFGRFASQMADGNSLVSRSFGAVNKTINRVAQIGLVALAAGFALAAREYVAFDNSIIASVAKFKDIETGTSQYTETLTALSAESRRVAAVSEFSATAVAGAADKFAMAGVTSIQTMALLAGTTDLATAANTDLVTAVDIATDSLGAFGKMTSDAGQLQKNLTQISDQMAKTTTTANTSLEDLFESVKAGAPAFTAAGQSMATFNAFTGIMANSGIKGSAAGTSLRNVMLRLADPTAEAASVLKKLGVVTQDSQGNFRDAIDILADMEKGLVGMGNAQQTAALSTIFGARSVTGINLLLAEGTDSLRAYRTEIENSSGAASAMAAAMRGSLKNQIEILKSGLIELGFKFVEAFEKDGREALQSLIDFIQRVDITPLIKFSQILVNVFTFIAGKWRIILAFAGAIKGLAIAMGILNLITQVFGVTLAATPVGWILAAVAALVFGIIMLATNWDKVTTFFREGWIKIKTILGNLWDTFSRLLDNPFFAIGASIIAPFIAIPALIIKNWEPIKMFFSNLWEGIKEVAMAVWDAIKTAFIASVDFMKGIFFTFADYLITIYASIFKGIMKAAAAVGDFLGLDVTAINDTIQKVENLQDKIRAESFIGGRNQEGNSNINTPETPTPTYGQPASTNPYMNGNLTVDFNNVPQNAVVRQSQNMPRGVNINIIPSQYQ